VTVGSLPHRGTASPRLVSAVRPISEASARPIGAAGAGPPIRVRLPSIRLILSGGYRAAPAGGTDKGAGSSGLPGARGRRAHLLAFDSRLPLASPAGCGRRRFLSLGLLCSGGDEAPADGLRRGSTDGAVLSWARLWLWR